MPEQQTPATAEDHGRPFIMPTVGRMVHYRPSAADLADPNFADPHRGEPCAAVIASVEDPHGLVVNLTVFDRNGAPKPRRRVLMRQAEDDTPENGGYAEWMSYQLGQAAIQKQVDQATKNMWTTENDDDDGNDPADPTDAA